MKTTSLFKLICAVLLCLCAVSLTSRSVTFSKGAQSDVKPTSQSVETMMTASPASVGDSATVTATAYPLDALQIFTWELTLDEDKMTSWLVRRVKEKLDDGKEYLSVVTTDNTATVTALEYFKYGIKYKTYWKLTAYSVENPEIYAVCSIQLG